MNCGSLTGLKKGGEIMEARGRRLGSIFPGYDGPALPRAIRSSRVHNSTPS